MQNFDRGKFNFAQIDFVVTALEENGLNPLGTTLYIASL
jgi:hypothetical protein